MCACVIGGVVGCWHKTERQVHVIGAGLCGKMASLESSVGMLIEVAWYARICPTIGQQARPGRFGPPETGRALA